MSRCADDRGSAGPTAPCRQRRRCRHHPPIRRARRDVVVAPLHRSGVRAVLRWGPETPAHDLRRCRIAVPTGRTARRQRHRARRGTPYRGDTTATRLDFVDTRPDHPVLAQRPELMRHGRACHSELHERDLAQRPCAVLASREYLDDAPAHRVSDDLERMHHAVSVPTAPAASSASSTGASARATS